VSYRLAPALFAVVLTPLAAAQVVNPADPARDRAQGAQGEAAEPGRLRSWELPATLVTGIRESPYRDDDLVGPYAAPRWTTRRVFPTTRVYVIPPGQFEIEHWTRVKVPDEGQTEVETQYEFELGLPHRFQIDVYAVTSKTGSEGDLDWKEQKFELRHALADWGELWMNPTLYLEYVERNAESDKVEAKLLLGDQLAPGWHFGTNLVFEHELGGALENEYGLTMGVSRTVVDQKLALGVEVKAALVDVHADRGEFEEELEIGPTLQYRPVPQMHVDFAPLVGIGADSRALDVFLVVGWEF